MSAHENPLQEEIAIEESSAIQVESVEEFLCRAKEQGTITEEEILQIFP